MFAPDHPFFRFRFCPLCGSPHFVQHGPSSLRCADCGFTYYTNPRGATVAVVVNDHDELLVARRANEPARGTLDLPGGFMEIGETAEQALLREVEEETGLVVAPDAPRYLFSMPNRYVYSGITCRTIDLFFELHVDGRPAVRAMDDVDSLRWVPLSGLRVGDFGLESVRAGLARYLSTRHAQACEQPSAAK